MKFCRYLTACLVLSLSPCFAGSPFGDDTLKIRPKTISTSNGSADAKTTVNEIITRQKTFGGHAFSRVICPAVVRAHISFTDQTPSYQRLSNLNTIRSRHGLKVSKATEVEKKEGSFLKTKKRKEITWEFEASESTAQLVCAQYGGKIDRQICPEFIPALEGLREILPLGRQNLETGRKILQLDLECDTLIQIQNQSGQLSAARVKAIARMKKVREEIQKLQGSVRVTSDRINQIFADKIKAYSRNGDERNYYFYMKLFTGGMIVGPHMEELRKKYD